MLVDRGPTNSYTAACKFTEKVWNAQNAGAVAVLVVNYADTHTTMVRAPPPPPRLIWLPGGSLCYTHSLVGPPPPPPPLPSPSPNSPLALFQWRAFKT